MRYLQIFFNKIIKKKNFKQSYRIFKKFKKDNIKYDRGQIDEEIMLKLTFGLCRLPSADTSTTSL